MYSSGNFKDVDKIYPSSYREILVVKDIIKILTIFLKHVVFSIATYLEHVKGMVTNIILLEICNH